MSSRTTSRTWRRSSGVSRRTVRSTDREMEASVPGRGAPQPNASRSVGFTAGHAGRLPRLPAPPEPADARRLPRVPARLGGARRRREPERDRPGRLPQWVSRVLRVHALPGAGPHDRRPLTRDRRCVRAAAATPSRGEHSARQPRIDPARAAIRLSPGRRLAPLSEDPGPVARSRALGAARRRVATRVYRSCSGKIVFCTASTWRSAYSLTVRLSSAGTSTASSQSERDVKP